MARFSGRRTPRTNAAQRRATSFAIAIVLGACSGEVASPTGLADDGTGGYGDSGGAATGGVEAQGGEGSGGTPAAGGGGVSGVATDPACDISQVVPWILDSHYAEVTGVLHTVGGYCECVSTGAADGGLSGALVFDSGGHLSDDTGTAPGLSKQAWLNSFSDRTWPCFAGQSIPYECHCFGGD